MSVNLPAPISNLQQATPDDDPFAVALRGFGPVGILAMLFVFLTGGGLTRAPHRDHHQPMRAP